MPSNNVYIYRSVHLLVIERCGHSVSPVAERASYGQTRVPAAILTGRGHTVDVCADRLAPLESFLGLWCVDCAVRGLCGARGRGGGYFARSDV